MKSLAIRKVSNFNITKMKTKNYKIKSYKTSLTINGRSYNKYKITFLKDINKNIIIDYNKLDDSYPPLTYKQINNFKIQISFYLFYDKNNKIIIMTTTVPIAKSFVKELQKEENAIGNHIKITNLQFDFLELKRIHPRIKSISFNILGNPNVKKKRFSGPRANNDPEAYKALKNHNVTFLIGKIDVNKESKTIGFSQSSSIIIYNKLTSNKSKGIIKMPYLYLLTEILIKGYSEHFIK